MVNKIILGLLTLILLVPIINFHASETTSDNISIEYANLESMQANEFQLVNVVVKVDNHWFNPQTTSVNIEYDQSQLNLVNIGYTSNKLETTSVDNTLVTGTTNSFTVTYQFFLMPNVDIKESDITVTQNSEEGTTTDTLTIATNSLTTPRIATVGKNKIEYKVTNYDSSGSEILLDLQFVAQSISDDVLFFDFTKNNMSVDTDDSYSINFSGDGDVTITEKNLFDLRLKDGDKFVVNITATKNQLDAKNDRFEFFLFISNQTQSVRLEPTFFPNVLKTDGVDKKRWKFIVIENATLCAIIILGIIHYRRSNLATGTN